MLTKYVFSKYFYSPNKRHYHFLQPMGKCSEVLAEESRNTTVSTHNWGAEDSLSLSSLPPSSPTFPNTLWAAIALNPGGGSRGGAMKIVSQGWEEAQCQTTPSYFHRPAAAASRICFTLFVHNPGSPCGTLSKTSVSKVCFLTHGVVMGKVPAAASFPKVGDGSSH